LWDIYCYENILALFQVLRIIQVYVTSKGEKLTRSTIFKHFNRLFPSSLTPLYQNEVKYSAFDMEMIFHSHANKTHFNKKGCALDLILKVRDFGTRQWAIAVCFNFRHCCLIFPCPAVLFQRFSSVLSNIHFLFFTH